jgi:tRNA (guanine37-N1)-methyltransferase
VRPFNEDGHTFIHHAADSILELTATNKNTVSIPAKRIYNAKASDPVPNPTVFTIPQTISHFVMNLPATAIDFLGAFNGLYHGHETLFEPHTSTKLPMVHVHCFSTKSDDNVREGIEICERISEKLGYVVKPSDEELVIHEVRDVAPKKRMFCASFRIPKEVAFRERIAR